MVTPIRFILNGELREVTEVAPTRTLLDWLREEATLSGTKEGCNEGDCGACTVAIRSLKTPDAPYSALNACIRFMPTLNGHEVVTVEYLNAFGDLHPVQRAFAHGHASQCGFCTPGFVMSAFAAGQGASSDLQALNDLYAGNLCRCTGYGPILDATREAFALPWPQLPSASAKEVQTALATPDTDVFSYKHGEHRFFAPTTLTALCRIAAEHPDATILAGATDVGLWVTKQGRDLKTIIWIGDVDGFAAIEDQGDHLWIGAGASYTDAWSALGKLYPDIGELVRRIGSVQVRNAGTIGGNIANGSPIGDTPPALIAAGAQLVLRLGDIERRLPLEEFFLAYGKQDRMPGEVVTAIEVPKPAANSHFSCYKISKRFDQDISAVCGAFTLQIDEGIVTSARIAFGGMAATPKRAVHAEAALIGQPFDQAHAEAAMQALSRDFQPIDDMRASAEYRLKVAKNLVMKCYVEHVQNEVQTRLVGEDAIAV